jgi:tetratricopeptide (TPR) repeat protein
MKKALLLAAILSVAVLSTACVNNFAVHELNHKASLFMEKGDYDEAIARLKSALDLDITSFMSHYNLGTAYNKTEDYVNAIKSYTEAVKLKPDFADAYYSLAVSEQNLVRDVMDGVARMGTDGKITKVLDGEYGPPTPAERELVDKLLLQAIEDYKTYLDLAPRATDRVEVESEMRNLNSLHEEYVRGAAWTY